MHQRFRFRPSTLVAELMFLPRPTKRLMLISFHSDPSKSSTSRFSSYLMPRTFRFATRLVGGATGAQRYVSRYLRDWKSGPHTQPAGVWLMRHVEQWSIRWDVCRQCRAVIHWQAQQLIRPPLLFFCRGCSLASIPHPSVWFIHSFLY